MNLSIINRIVMVILISQTLLACQKNTTHNIAVHYEYVKDGYQNGLHKVYHHHNYGFVDDKGNIVIPIEYDMVHDFSEGLLAVSKNNQFGFLDKTGKIIIPLQYDYADNFYKGIVLVGKNHKYGFIDKQGQEVIPIQYENLEDFNNEEIGKKSKL